MTDFRPRTRLYRYRVPREITRDPAKFLIGSAKTTLGVTWSEFGIFLRELTEPILAFGLAGYHVPVVETVAPSYALTGGFGQEFDTATIRIDLRGDETQITVNPRDPSQYPEKPHILGGLVRFYLEPMFLDGVPVNLAFDEAGVATYLDEAAPSVSEPMADFAVRRYPPDDGNAPKFVRRQGLGDFRDLLAEQSGKLTGAATAPSLDFYSGLAPNFDRAYPAGDDQRSETSYQYLQSLIDGVLRPVTMALGRKVGDAAGEWFSADPARRPPYPPGGLWVFDPSTWGPGTRLYDGPSIPLRRSPEQVMEKVRRGYAKLFDALSADISLVEPGEEDTGAGRLGVAERGLLVTGLAYAHLRPPAADLSAPGLAPVHAGAMATQRLIHSAYSECDVIVGGGTFDPRDLDERMTLWIAVKCLKDFGMQPGAFSASLFAGRIRRNTALALSIALRADIDDEDEARSVADTYADDFDYLPWSLSAFALFDAGLYSIDHRIGSAGLALDDEDEIPYDVQAHLVPETGRIVLTLPDYAHKGIELSLTYAGLGYGLGEGVTWEYCPPAESTGDEVLDGLRQALDPQYRLAKLKIAAAPGVAVEIVEWPEAEVPVVVIRVQDVVLVPSRGELINDQLLRAPRTVSLDDLTDEAGIDADERLAVEEKTTLKAIRTALETEEEKPLVSVRYIRDGTKQGVEIEYVGKAPHARWPGTDGAAKVRILLDQSSGRDRFAYALYPVPAQQQRVVDYIQEGPDRIPIYDMIHVLRFRVVVHATVSVAIHAEDSGFGTFLPDAPVFDHVYYRARQANDAGAILTRNIADIAPQGCPLDFDTDPAATVVSTWLDDVPGGGVADMQSQVALVRDSGPVDAIEWRNLADWLTFAADMGIGFIPFVGDVTDVGELLLSLFTGTNKWGQPMNNYDRAIMLGGVLLPFVSSAALGAMKSASKLADPTIPDDWLRQITPRETP